MNGARHNAPGLAFKPHLEVEVVPAEGVFLVSEHGVTAVRGTGLVTLAPLLDGTRTLDALIAETAPTLPAAQTRHLIGGLLDAGLLTHRRAADDTRDADRAYWELAGLDGDLAADRVRTGPVRVVGVGATGTATATALTEALTAAGLHVPETFDRPPALTVAGCDDYLDPALADLDAAHRATGVPWLLVRCGGEQPWIGPLFRPGDADAACWHCLAEALRRNRPVHRYLEQALGRPVGPPASAHPAGRLLALHLAGLEAAKWLAGRPRPGPDTIWTLDTLTLTGRHHPVRRRPQCAGCGDPEIVAHRVRAPVRPGTRIKADTAYGDRASTPEEILDRYGHLVDPLTGVLGEITRDTRGPDFLNCFHAGHNPAAAPTGRTALHAGLRTHSSGKGPTARAARVGALCEAVERFSGDHHGDEPVVRAAYADLGDNAVHPDLVQLFHPRQFADRERWNAEHAPAHHVCAPFDDHAPVHWTPTWSLTEDRPRLLPTSLLYYNAPRDPGGRRCVAGSNGCAAGGSLEDAILQGFLELVERDAVALWWYNRTRQRGVDLDTFEDPWIARVRGGHTELHRQVWALDLTSDLGVPVFVALSRRVDKPAEDISLGFGAHFDPGTALRRALAEVNQMLPPVARVAADGSGYGCEDPVALHWWRTATIAEHPYVTPDPGLPASAPGDFPHRRHRDLREDVRTIENLVRAHDLELLVLDQTRPDIGLPVVRVIVPGLRPISARFAPGRLYDTPVRLGRLTAPTRYADLNPIPLFL